MTTLLIVLAFIVVWVILAAAAFATMDVHSNNEFRHWYEEAPFAWCKALCWIFWPVLLMEFFMRSRRS